MARTMTTIFEALREDHGKQRTLASLLVKTSGDSDGRSELFARLRTALESHAAAEERFFYRLLFEHDMTLERARHSVAEHQELDELLEQLDVTSPSSSGWLPTARKLVDRLTHHLDEEEHEVFQLAGRVLTEDQKHSLADGYRSMMQDRRGAA